MKKGRFLMTILILLIFCTACEAKDPENVFEMPPTESVSADVTEAETTATKPPVTESSSTALEFDSPEEFQHRNLLQIGGFVRYGDEILFNHIKKGQIYLYSLDMATGEVSTFCKDATCYHVSAKCATAALDWNLEEYGGNVYGANFIIDFDDTTNVTKSYIMGLKDGNLEKIVDGTVRQFWHANGDLYAITADNSLVVFENGKGTPRILIEEYVYDYNVMVGQYLYGFSWSPQGIMRFDLAEAYPQGELIVEDAYMAVPDGKHIYYSDSKTRYLYRCDLDGSGAELLLDQPIMLGSLNHDEEYVYFRLYTGFDPEGQDPYLKGPDSQDIYRMSKEDPTQVEKIAELPEPAREIYIVPGYDQLIVSNVAEQDEENVYYLVAKDGSSVEKLELPGF